MRKRAIILAAGRGSRMGALTSEQPKCYTKFSGAPLIAWQLWALKNAGFQNKDIAIVTGYKRELLEKFGFPTFHNDLWAETNMVSSLRCADDWMLNHEVYVCYSDIAFHPSILEITKDALPQAELLIPYNKDWESLWRDRFGDPLIDAETFQMEGDRLLSIGDKPKNLQEVQGQYMGILRFRPAAWKLALAQLNLLSESQQKKIHLTGLLNLLLEKGIPIHCTPVPGKWLEIDSGEDLQAMEAKIADANQWFSKAKTEVLKIWQELQE